MHASFLPMRAYFAGTYTLLLLALCVPLSAHAASNARFELRPHCDHTVVTDPHNCPRFDIRDPVNLQTAVLSNGQELDMDLVIINQDQHPIDRFRAWIAYDPSVLHGLELSISPEYPVPTPGENVMVSSEGYMKISGTAQAPLSTAEITVAHLRVRVTAPTTDGTPLTLYDAAGTVESRTGIFEKQGDTETNLLVANPGYLYVQFAITTATASSASSSIQTVSNVASAASASSVSPVIPSTVFTMLQVQGVRITTEGSSVFLAWDTLPSSELVGYNVYYGTTTGRYIQRRSVDSTASSITIRSLPVGTTYYVAVRGVNAREQETEFSQEVGISVGNPSTSTSPLTANSLLTRTPDTNGNIAGETGVSSVLLTLLILSAVIGTGFAFRRQWNS